MLLGYLLFTGYLPLRIALSAVVAVLCALPLGRWRYSATAKLLQNVARRRWLTIGLVFCMSFAATASLSIKRGNPLAYVHDEFSYLLAGDTFAHGRLTNPTPTDWEHFESMHILVRPSYQSKYPPGQGLFLALGQAVFGHPIWGAWISTALACAAGCWMLYAFASPPWALLGGLLLAIHPQMLEWGQRYWGGSVGALGGCLLLGGWGRVASWLARRAKPRAAGAVWMAVGMFILAIGRPFEGLVLTVLLLAGLAFSVRRFVRGGARAGRGLPHQSPWADDADEPSLVGAKEPAGNDSVVPAGLVLAGMRQPTACADGLLSVAPAGLHNRFAEADPACWRAIIKKLLLPTLLILLPCMSWLGYYNWRVTGNPLRLPYQEHHAQYGVVPLFILFEKTPEPVYHDDAVKLFHVREQGYAYRHGHWPTIIREMGKSLVELGKGSVGNVELLALPLLIVPWMLTRSRRMRFLIIALLLFAAALMVETWMSAHYASPAAGLCLVLIVGAMRWMWRGGGRVGQVLVRVAVAGTVLSAGMWWATFFNWTNYVSPWVRERQRIASELAEDGSRNVVFMQYDLYRPIVPWGQVAMAVCADLLRHPILGQFAQPGLEGLPGLPPPIPGESRTIWISENEMTDGTYQTIYSTWPDRDWWRLELRGASPELERICRWLADRYIRQQPGNHVVMFRNETDNKDETGETLTGSILLRHLLIRHNVHEEWVYNAADLESAPVIWARDLGDEKNRELMEDYAGRKAWVLNPDRDVRRMPDGSLRYTPRPYVPGSH